MLNFLTLKSFCKNWFLVLSSMINTKRFSTTFSTFSHITDIKFWMNIQDHLKIFQRAKFPCSLVSWSPRTEFLWVCGVMWCGQDLWWAMSAAEAVPRPANWQYPGPLAWWVGWWLLQKHCMIVNTTNTSTSTFIGPNLILSGSRVSIEEPKGE